MLNRIVVIYKKSLIMSLITGKTVSLYATRRGNLVGCGITGLGCAMFYFNSQVF